MQFTQRLRQGVKDGSITSACASHSAATSFASASFGSARNCRAGVRTALPSSVMAKPSSTGSTDTV